MASSNSQPSSSILKLFKPSKNPEIEIEIHQITNTNLTEVSKNISYMFKQYDPVISKPEFTMEYFHDNMVLPLVKRSIHDGLGIIAYDRANGKWVGALLAEDLFGYGSDYELKDSDYNIKDPENRFTSVLKWMDIMISRGISIFNKATKPYEQYNFIYGCINEDYWSCGIMREMLRFLMYEHPKINKAKIIMGECSNIRSKKTVEAVGWKTIWEIKYEDIAKMDKNLEVYEDVREFMKKEKGLDIADKGYLVVYVRE